MGRSRDRWTALHLAPASALNEYLANNRLRDNVGSKIFSELLARDFRREHPPRELTKPFVLYHAWLPGWVELDAGGAAAARALMGGASPRPGQVPAVRRLSAALRRMGWDTGARVTPAALDQLVRGTRDRFIAWQNAVELRRFLELVHQRQPEVIVEIGTCRGGLLFCLCQVAAANGLIVSIDLPGGPGGGAFTAEEGRLFETFGRPGQEVRLLSGNSHHAQTRESLKRLLDGRGVDLLFIDGDHSYGGVRADFEMYGELVGRNGLIAFHDITGQPDQAEGFDVGVFWSELKSRYPVSEIIDERGTVDRTDWSTPQAWGIGLLTRW